MNIINLPKPDELAYNLDRMPQDDKGYKSAMDSLATSVIGYSQQIDQLFNPELLKQVEEDKNAEQRD